MTVLTVAASPAAAQVGHPPDRSPYRDIRKGHTVTALGGYFGGAGGRFEIAPHTGSAFGLRYDIRTASAIQLGLALARADLERLVVDPFVELTNRVSGPVQQTVTFVELDLQLNLTGGKTWRRLAPFVGAGTGLTFTSGTPADTSGFEFGTKIYFAPHAGARVFITDRLHLRTEARVTFWQVKYPPSFTREPPLEPGNPPDDSNAVIPDGRVSEWSTSSWLQAGLGYSFSL
ncbi:MAG: hypothetical protein ACREMX_04435 [Gemmatimonadales bacterium]